MAAKGRGYRVRSYSGATSVATLANFGRRLVLHSRRIWQSSLALTAASGTLAWNHRRQRSRLISRIGASETVKNYRNILTGGDLVMDDRLRLSAIQMAQALREEVRQRRSPQPPEPPPYTLGGL